MYPGVAVLEQTVIRKEKSRVDEQGESSQRVHSDRKVDWRNGRKEEKT